MIFLEEAIEKFEELEPEVILTVNGEKNSRIIEELSKKYGVELAAVVIYFVIGELPAEELPAYLERELEFTPEQAKAATQDLATQVFEPLTRRLLFLNADPDKEKDGITVEKEREVLRQIFSEGLLSEIAEHFIIKNAVNYQIFDLLEQDFNFKRELERLLYENNESVTEKNITVKGKNVSPTIANWLADFIDKNNTGDFDAVTLSNYLTNTENTRNLSPQERERLSELLNVYRNLKFFPETVKDKPMEEWRIIPFDLQEVKNFMAEQDKKFEEEEEGMEKITEDNKIKEQIKPEDKLSQYDWSKIVGLERRALLEELGVSQREFVRWLEAQKK